MPTKLPGKEILGGGLTDETGEYLEVAGSTPARRNPVAQRQSAWESPVTE